MSTKTVGRVRIWDRKSPRHKWRRVGDATTVDHAEAIFKQAVLTIQDAIEKGKWPSGAQVAFDTAYEPISGNYDALEWDRPANAKMTTVATITDPNA